MLDNTLSNTLPAENHSLEDLPEAAAGNNSVQFSLQENVSFQAVGSQMDSISQRKDSDLVRPGAGGGFVDIQDKDGLQNQDSFGRWMNYIMTDSPGLLDDKALEPSITDHQSSVADHIFKITDVSPAWALSTETTKVFYFSDDLLIFFLGTTIPKLKLLLQKQYTIQYPETTSYNNLMHNFLWVLPRLFWQKRIRFLSFLIKSLVPFLC